MPPMDIDELVEWMLNHTHSVERIVSLTGTAVVLCPLNTRRISLTVGNVQGGGNLFLAFDATPTSSVGLRLAASFGPFQWNWWNDGNLVTRQIRAATDVNGNVQVWETYVNV